MLTNEIRKDLEEYYMEKYGAIILNIAPYMAENSDGEMEQFYQVNMASDEESFYINVDEYGAVCGGREMRYDVYRK